MSPFTFRVERLATPIGEMVVLCDDDGAPRAVDWSDCAPRMHRRLKTLYGAGNVKLVEVELPSAVVRAFERYFAGELAALDALPAKTAGTSFQRAVWTALREIPPGETTTYGALARALGRPRAVRAVGAANGANPIGVVIPCHRVVGSDGSLTGYGGGLRRKRWLLDHERTHRLESSERHETR